MDVIFAVFYDFQDELERCFIADFLSQTARAR